VRQLASGVHSTQLQAAVAKKAQRDEAKQGGNQMLENAGTRSVGNVTEDCLAERRLWIAVLVMAVEDWRKGTLRARREAQKFLFEDQTDYERVCASAGVDPGGFRSSLLRIGKKIAMQGVWDHKMAA
jgi:hypothetical protein